MAEKQAVEAVNQLFNEDTLNAPSLVVDYYKVNTDYITGSVTGNVKKFKLIVDGKEYFPGFKLLKNNRFEVYAKNKVSATSKTITLVSLDENDQEVTRQTVTLEQTVTGTVTPQAYTLGGADRYVR